jgi:hypothetical protein
MFRNPGPGTLADARMPRWRTLTLSGNSRAAAIARLNGDIPLLVESAHSAGRVIVSAVPLDDSNRANLVEFPAFAPLVHELVAYLGSARSVESTVAAGQPIRWELPKSTPDDGWKVVPPEGPPKTITADQRRLTIVDAGEPGVYTLTNAKWPTRYFVVAADPTERDLTPLDEADRERLGRYLPGPRWISEPAEALAPASAAALPTELNWLAFGGVIALLCVELWMTRRRALAAA